MPFLRKLAVYFSPVVCVLLLLLAFQISRQKEFPPAANLRRPKALQLACDRQLSEPLSAILEAWQRRNLASVEITILEPDSSLKQPPFPDAGLLLTVENVLPGKVLDTDGHRPLFLAWLRLTAAVRADSPVPVEHWQDLIRPGLRLAIAQNRSQALSNCLKSILAEKKISWETVTRNIVLSSDDGDILIRAVLTGQADVAILWKPQFRDFGGLAAELPFSIVERRHAGVVLYKLHADYDHPETDRLLEFLQGSLARDIWCEFDYSLTD